MDYFTASVSQGESSDDRQESLLPPSSSASLPQQWPGQGSVSPPTTGNINTGAPSIASGPAPRIRRRNRMITSCLECRRRKLKCNKSHPCTNCVKFTRDCVFLAPALDQGKLILSLLPSLLTTYTSLYLWNNVPMIHLLTHLSIQPVSLSLLRLKRK